VRNTRTNNNKNQLNDIQTADTNRKGGGTPPPKPYEIVDAPVFKFHSYIFFFVDACCAAAPDYPSGRSKWRMGLANSDSIL
jgi:hypothetical protein